MRGVGMITFAAVELMVEARQHVGCVGGVMLTFLELTKMVDDRLWQ